MPSLIPGFEYDIFISYRHNDNTDGWVTDFVQNLERELRAAVKEPLSIYFDKNPHDGLLETHSVDKSLEGKLNALIFIPILSQTYCDVRSFAWQNEFCAFNALSKSDNVGSDVRLTNGNVSSRILPIKIHELDSGDAAAIESEIGGALRAIEFIFKSAGVNRPLHPHEEHPQDNQNKTFYRDQINKVANAIKEIIHGVKSPVRDPTNTRFLPTPQGSQKRKLAAVAAIVLAIAIAAYFFVPDWLEARSGDLPAEHAIAVLYFDNMSGDETQEYLSDGLTEEIITRLTKIDGMRVVSRTSVRQYKGQSHNLKDIAGDLNVSIVLEGSVRKAGNQLRVTAQLINAETDQHLWAETFDRELKDVFAVQAEIAQAIAEKFRIQLTPEQNLKVAEISTPSTEAYEYYLKARHIAFHQYYFIWDSSAFVRSKALYEKAIQVDPGFALAYAGMADLLDAKRTSNVAKFSDELDSLRHAMSWKAYLLDPNSAFVNNVRIWMLSNRAEPLRDSARFHARRAIELERNDYYNWSSMASMWQTDALPELAIPFFERATELNPIDPSDRAMLATCYLISGQKEKADRQYQLAYELAPTTQYVGSHLTIFWLIRHSRFEEAQKMMDDLRRKYPTLKFSWAQAMLEVASGRKEEALKKFPNTGGNLEMLCALGKFDDALTRINEITSKEDIYMYLQNAPTFDSLRANEQFQSILVSQQKLHHARLEKYKPMAEQIMKLK